MKGKMVSFAVAPKHGALLTWVAFDTGDRSFLHGSGLHWGRVTTYDCRVVRLFIFSFVVDLFCWDVGRYVHGAGSGLS